MGMLELYTRRQVHHHLLLVPCISSTTFNQKKYKFEVVWFNYQIQLLIKSKIDYENDKPCLITEFLYKNNPLIYTKKNPVIPKN